ncbi:MAG: universal stress protein [Candidatus Binatia bacterium]
MTVQPLRNVLAALDLSPASAPVLQRVARLPLPPGASITLLHVVPSGLGMRSARDAVTKEEIQRALATAAARVAELASAEVQVRTAVEYGVPFIEIIRRARGERAELIVLGRHGHRIFADALIGSTAERVFRKGDVATLIVCGTPDGAYRRPLVAVDLSDTSRRALELALRVIDSRAEPIQVLHSWTIAAGGDPEEREGTALSSFLAQFGEAAERWRVTVRPGDARTVILAEAAKRAIDLLVLGTHGRSALAQVLVGSVAEAVVRAATCDVLVARAPRRDFRLP